MLPETCRYEPAKTHLETKDLPSTCLPYHLLGLELPDGLGGRKTRARHR